MWWNDKSSVTFWWVEVFNIKFFGGISCCMKYFRCSSNFTSNKPDIIFISNRCKPEFEIKGVVSAKKYPV